MLTILQTLGYCNTREVKSYDWLQFRNCIGNFLLEKANGLLDFSHQHLKEIVEYVLLRKYCRTKSYLVIVKRYQMVYKHFASSCSIVSSDLYFDGFCNSQLSWLFFCHLPKYHQTWNLIHHEIIAVSQFHKIASACCMLMLLPSVVDCVLSLIKVWYIVFLFFLFQVVFFLFPFKIWKKNIWRQKLNTFFIYIKHQFCFLIFLEGIIY